MWPAEEPRRYWRHPVHERSPASRDSALIAAAFGAIVGSFPNVCIYRLPLGKSIVFPRRHARIAGARSRGRERAGRQLAVLRDAAAHQTSIGVRYPIIEALTAAMFAAAWWCLRSHAASGVAPDLRAALIVLFAIDLEHHLLPNVITCPGLSSDPLQFAEPGRVSSCGNPVGGGGCSALPRSTVSGTKKDWGWATSRCSPGRCLHRLETDAGNVDDGLSAGR